MKNDIIPVKVRMPERLKKALLKEAKRKGLTLNGEIVARLAVLLAEKTGKAAERAKEAKKLNDEKIKVRVVGTDFGEVSFPNELSVEALPDYIAFQRALHERRVQEGWSLD